MINRTPTLLSALDCVVSPRAAARRLDVRPILQLMLAIAALQVLCLLAGALLHSAVLMDEPPSAVIGEIITRTRWAVVQAATTWLGVLAHAVVFLPAIVAICTKFSRSNVRLLASAAGLSGLAIVNGLYLGAPPDKAWLWIAASLTAVVVVHLAATDSRMSSALRLTLICTPVLMLKHLARYAAFAATGHDLGLLTPEKWLPHLVDVAPILRYLDPFTLWWLMTMTVVVGVSIRGWSVARGAAAMIAAALAIGMGLTDSF